MTSEQAVPSHISSAPFPMPRVPRTDLDLPWQSTGKSKASAELLGGAAHGPREQRITRYSRPRQTSPGFDPQPFLTELCS